MSGGAPKRLLLLGLCAFFLLLFTALGVWQLDRRQWKLDLIERVEARIAAPPSPAPPRTTWATLNSGEFEYRRVRVTGRFDHARETLVDALTERGAGDWLLTPLVTPGGTILVNRGFLPPDRSAPAWRAAAQLPGTVTITGLMRASEPEGRVLRANQPAADRWFSRDVAAIAARRGLMDVAPFFIDADATPNPGGYPVGGLTVVRFRNTHLVYALTWFVLAGLSLFGLVLTWRSSAKRD